MKAYSECPVKVLRLMFQKSHNRKKLNILLEMFKQDQFDKREKIYTKHLLYDGDAQRKQNKSRQSKYTE